MERCSAGGGNQTFQWEHLSLIDSITWSTNLEIDTPICLEWQINLFQVSEEEWNEFQKLHTHETNVKIPLLIFTSSEMNVSFCFSLRDLLLQYSNLWVMRNVFWSCVHAMWANYRDKKCAIWTEYLYLCLWKTRQYLKLSPHMQVSNDLTAMQWKQWT